MKRVTRFELAKLNENELPALMRHAFNELAKSNSGTYQRRNATANLN
jgi:hypothetical protein